MRFGTHANRGRTRDASVPFINLAVLLLIFFLFSATLAARPPFDLALPAGYAVEDAGVAEPLFVGPEGDLALGPMRGEAVLDAIAERAGGPIELRAHAGVPASDIATLLSRLTDLGVTEVRLVLHRP